MMVPEIVYATGEHWWSKLVWNAAFNAVTALTDTTMGAAARHPSLRALLRASMAETLAVATAEGVALPDGLIEFLLGLGDQYGDARTSMHQDVRAGRPTEHEALGGVVSRRGRKHGIATPVNDTLTALLDGRAVADRSEVRGTGSRLWPRRDTPTPALRASCNTNR